MTRVNADFNLCYISASVTQNVSSVNTQRNEQLLKLIFERKFGMYEGIIREIRGNQQLRQIIRVTRDNPPF